MQPFGSEKGAPCAERLKAWGSQRRGRAEGSHPTTLVLDPAQQPLSEEVQRPAHNSPDELRHLGAQGLQGAGWASGIELWPPCLETALPHLLAQPLPPLAQPVGVIARCPQARGSLPRRSTALVDFDHPSHFSSRPPNPRCLVRVHLVLQATPLPRELRSHVTPAEGFPRPGEPSTAHAPAPSRAAPHCPWLHRGPAVTPSRSS